MLQLRDYQHEAVASILDKFHQGISRQLISLPTGCGKTILFAQLIKQVNQKTLVIAHTDELINQAVEKIQWVIGKDADIGRCKAEDNEIDRAIVVASIQTISREKRLEQLQAHEFQVCVVDECHHATAESYKKVFEALGFLEEKLLVGFTATPKRADGEALGSIFQEIAFQKTILDMIKAGYLCDLRGTRVFTGISLERVETKEGDFVGSQLAAVVNTESRNALIVNAYLEQASGKKALAFCADVKHSHDLAAAFQDAGISARAVYGEMKDEERKAVLKAFASGTLQVVTNCMVLTEGFDEPSIEAVLMCRPTRSESLYTQCVGRGTRLFPGKSECVVLDFTDRHNKILSLGTLLGKGKPIKEKMSLLEAVEEELKERQAVKANGQLVVQTLDLFERSQLNWTSIHDHYRLALGNGSYVLVRNLGNGKFTAAVTIYDMTTELLIENADLEMCTGVGEEYVRRKKRLTLADKRADWRKKPVSQKQIELLSLLGLTSLPKTMTMGEASELIDREKRKKEAWKFEEPTEMQIRFLKERGLYWDGMLRGEAHKLISLYQNEVQTLETKSTDKHHSISPI